MTPGAFTPSPSPPHRRLRTFRFRSGSGDLTSLASPRRETPWPVIPDGRHDPDHSPSYYRLATGSFGRAHFFRAVPCNPRLVSGSFHPPSGVLFSFPSRYCVRYRTRDVFRVGSWCLPASDAISKAPYSGFSPSYPAQLRLRGFHPLWRGIPADFGFPGEGLGRVLQLHIPSGFLHQVRFALCPFHSPLLRASLLLSFPPGTPMFRFPGFPLAAASAGVLLRQEVPFGDPGINGCMRLPRAFRRLPRPSSAPEPSHPPAGFFGRVFFWSRGGDLNSRHAGFGRRVYSRPLYQAELPRVDLCAASYNHL